MPTNPSIKEVILRYQIGDDEPFVKFLEDQKAVMYAWSFSILRDRADTKDCLQDVYEKLFSASLEKRQEWFRDVDTNPVGFLFTMFRNHALGILKKKNNRLEKSKGYVILQPQSDNTDEQFERMLQSELLNVAIPTLPKKIKDFILLWLRMPRQKQEMMNILNLSDTEYRQLYQKAIKDLRREIIRLRSLT